MGTGVFRQHCTGAGVYYKASKARCHMIRQCMHLRHIAVLQNDAQSRRGTSEEVCMLSGGLNLLLGSKSCPTSYNATTQALLTT